MKKSFWVPSKVRVFASICTLCSSARCFETDIITVDRVALAVRCTAQFVVQRWNQDFVGTKTRRYITLVRLAACRRAKEVNEEDEEEDEGPLSNALLRFNSRARVQHDLSSIWRCKTLKNEQKEHDLLHVLLILSSPASSSSFSSSWPCLPSTLLFSPCSWSAEWRIVRCSLSGWSARFRFVRTIERTRSKMQVNCPSIFECGWQRELFRTVAKQFDVSFSFPYLALLSYPPSLPYTSSSSSSSSAWLHLLSNCVRKCTIDFQLKRFDRIFRFAIPQVHRPVPIKRRSSR